MPNQVPNYKCPSCTGPLHFVGESGKLECDYCGSTYTVEEIEKLYGEKAEQAAQAFESAQAAPPSASGEWDTSDIGSEWGADGAKMRAYSCPSCSAELICDETTAATSCPYCGNPTIVPGQFKGVLKPDYVLPFKLKKEQAVEALKKHYQGKRLLPNAFTNENHIQEIKGVYVPFWLYDGEADADISYEATEVSSYSTSRERITKTKHFNVRRAGTVPFEKIPADASSKMPDNYMDAIEPYDYGELKPFSLAYLPGFLADKYDVSAEECAARADLRAANTAADIMRSTVGSYSSCVERSRSIHLRRGKVHYALMPVWTLSTQWRGQNFLFTINGQTGKLAGELPVDKGKYWRWFAGVAVGVTAVAAVLIKFLL